MRSLYPNVVLMLAISMTSAVAQARPGHETFHEFYKGLKSPEGESCCNERDCHSVDGRFVREDDGRFSLEIRIKGRWVRVPPERILPQASPDGAVHACYQDPAPFMTETEGGLIIRCVIIGGFS